MAHVELLLQKSSNQLPLYGFLQDVESLIDAITVTACHKLVKFQSHLVSVSVSMQL